MTEPRSAAQEAGDPSTSPERLLELTEKHPQLHRLIVLNPSCPEVARRWILATNPWAQQAYEQSLESGQSPGTAAGAPPEPSPGTEDAPETAGAPTEAPPEPLAAAVTETAPHAPVDDDPYAVSAWGDLGTDRRGDAPAASAPGRAREDPPTGAVRIAPDAGVVALGPVSPRSPVPPAPDVSTSSGATAASAAAGAAPTPAPWTYDAPAAPGAYGWSAASGGDGAAGIPGAPWPSGASSAPGAPAESTTGPPPGAGGPEHGGGSARPSRRAWYACGGCLLLSLLLVIAVVFATSTWFSETGPQPRSDSSTASAEPSPTEESPQEASPTEEPAEEETPSPDPVSPAPEGAREMTELRSPSGNISCMLEEGSVACSLVERDYREAGLEDCENGPFSIAVGEGEAATACGSSFLSDSGPTLEYGESATRGVMACTSRSSGMTCWNTLTGKGFMVNRSTYETF